MNQRVRELHRSLDASGEGIVVPAAPGTHAFADILFADTGEIISMWLPVIAWKIKSDAAKWPVTLPESLRVNQPTIEYPSGLIETGGGETFLDRQSWINHQGRASTALPAA